jgi:hypothetical protein
MAVKKYSTGAFLLVAMCATGGCEFHEIGLVHGSPGQTTLDTPSDGQFQLGLGEDARPLRYLDGHEAEIWGSRIGHRVHVTDWKLGEGLHGMPSFVGVIEEQGAQIGMLDRNSKAYYVFDQESIPVLRPMAGKTVMVEGYVDGAHRVRVLFFRLLGPEGS